MELPVRRNGLPTLVRETIVDGTFPPRSRLSEPEICSAVGVYRNTLRESFHLSICR
ncbi:hypothetical protein COO55_01445 [Rhodococcus opacus]|nr:GntR family transcriptional regulator [Rhodococcus opacus]RKM77116.1 hypothetical protein COO55_01445 [Rhodococcus opacus]